MDFGLIFSIVFFALVLIGALRGLRRGKRKSWQNCLARFIITIISAIISIFVAKAIASTIAETLYESFVKGQLPQEALDLFEDIPSAPAIMLALVSMILAPILFYFVNFIIKLILKILSPLLIALITAIASLFKKKEAAPEATDYNGTEAILSDGTAMEIAEEDAYELGIFDEEEDGKSKKKKKKEKKKEEKPKKTKEKKPKYFASGKGVVAGIIFAVLSGVISVFIFFAPISGYLGMLGMTVSVVKENSPEALDGSEEIIDLLDGVTNNAAVKTVNVLGGKLIFKALTTFDVSGEDVSLWDEAELSCDVAKALLVVSNEEKTPNEKSEALRDVSSAFENSNIIPILVSEVLSGAATAWESGETFCGIELPVEDGAAKDFILEVLALFKDSNATTVKQDASTIINIIAVLIKNDIIENMPEDPTELIGNKQFVSDIFFEIFENDRLNVLVNSLISTGVELVTEIIGIPADLDGTYAEFTAALCAPQSKDSIEALEAEYDKIFKKYGIDITKSSLGDFANNIYEDYGLQFNDNVSSIDISSYLSDITINTDNGEESVNISDKASFISNTLLVTRDSIKPSNETSNADSKTQADALADIFASVFDITDLFEGEEETSIANTVKSLGSILDKFAACASIGKDCVNNLVVAMLQSDMVYDVISMDKVSATHFANAIVKDTSNGKTYEDAMADIAKVINKITEVSESDEFDKDGIKEVLSTLTPTTSTALKHIVTGNLAEQIGFEAANSGGVSDILSSVFDNIASAKENGMDDETYAAETEKIADLLDTTMNITGDSADSIDVETYVNSVMDSTIVSASLRENVFKDGENATIDPLEAGTELDDGEKNSLIETLQNRIDNAPANEKEDTEKTAIAVAAYLNIQVEIVGGTVQIVEP